MDAYLPGYAWPADPLAAFSLDALPSLAPTPPPPPSPPALPRPQSPYASWCSSLPPAGTAAPHPQEALQPPPPADADYLLPQPDPVPAAAAAASPQSPARSVTFAPGPRLLRGGIVRPGRVVKAASAAAAAAAAAAATCATRLKEEDHVDQFDQALHSHQLGQGDRTDCAAQLQAKYEDEEVDEEGDEDELADDFLDLSGTTAARSRKMTQSERDTMLHKRRLRNRQSAARSREKQRNQVHVLAGEVSGLQQVVAALRDEISRLSAENADLKASNSKLVYFS